MQRLVHRLLRWFRWHFEGVIPDQPKMIILGAPHTSNWDFLIFLGALHAYDIEVKYMAKEGLFKWPLGPLLRFWGGIPVGGSRKGGVVGQVVEAFDNNDRMILLIAPEGTRAWAPHWRSGFLRIAETADVPVVMVSIDIPRRRVEVGPNLRYAGGDVTPFMDEARAFYAAKEGVRPTSKGPVRVEEER